MDKVKEALTRKLGPLPAWAWLTIFGVGYYLYKNKIASSSATQATSTVPSPVTPQSPITVSPGDSVYNPNTGTLTTAPGGSSGGSGGGGGYSSGGSGSGSGSLNNALNAIAQALGNLNNSSANGTASGVVATSGLKSQARKIVTRKAKPKTAQQARTTTTLAAPAVTIPSETGARQQFLHMRSTAAVHEPKHATTISVHKAQPHPRTIHLIGARQTYERMRARTPVVTHAVRQRRVAATQPARRPEPRPNIRPSAPKTRNVNRRRK